MELITIKNSKAFNFDFSDKLSLLMPIGIPGSGKSTLSEELSKYNAKIISSDTTSKGAIW